MPRTAKEPRNDHLTVRLNPTEKSRLLYVADAAGVRPADLIRGMLMNAWYTLHTGKPLPVGNGDVRHE